MRSNKAILVLFVSTAIALVAFILIRAKQRQIFLVSDIIEEKKIVEQAINEWAKMNYVSTSNAGECQSAYAELEKKLRSGGELTANQAASLVSAIKGFVDAFSVGNFQTYREFRFPPQLNYSITQAGSNRLNSYSKNFPSLRPVAPSFAENWVKQYKKKTNDSQIPVSVDDKIKNFVYDYSGHNYYSNYFSGVCFDEASITITNFLDSAPRLIYHNFLKNHEEKFVGFKLITTNFSNLRFIDLGADRFKMFEIEPSMKDLLRIHHQVLVANCLFYIHVECPDSTYVPFLVRFYLVNAPEKWVVDDVVVANSFTDTNCASLIVF